MGLNHTAKSRHTEYDASLKGKPSNLHLWSTQWPLWLNQYPLAPLGCKAVIYKDSNPEDHGHCGMLTDGTWVHQWTTTNVTCTAFPRLRHIQSRVPRNCSPNIAKYLTWPCTITFEHSPTSWPNQWQLQAQLPRVDGSLSYYNQRSTICYIPFNWLIHCKQSKGCKMKNREWLMKHPSSPFHRLRTPLQ